MGGASRGTVYLAKAGRVTGRGSGLLGGAKATGEADGEGAAEWAGGAERTGEAHVEGCAMGADGAQGPKEPGGGGEGRGEFACVMAGANFVPWMNYNEFCTLL